MTKQNKKWFNRQERNNESEMSTNELSLEDDYNDFYLPSKMHVNTSKYQGLGGSVG